MMCHCGSGSLFDECCGAILAGQHKAETAEQLMRSRYSAYVTGNVDYLLGTTHPDSRLHTMEQDIREGMADTQWLQLCILNSGEDHVEFIAEYVCRGELGRIHERSVFEKLDGEWFYVGQG